MVARKSRFGKTFYSCSTFPECDVIVNDLAQLSEKYIEHPRTAYIKKAGKGRKGVVKKAVGKKSPAAKAAPKKTAVKKTATPRQQPLQKLSSELTQVVGATELSRGEVMKKVWEYIHAHHLQDTTNKRQINPDALLGKVIGSEPIDMFKMTAALGKHIQKKT